MSTINDNGFDRKRYQDERQSIADSFVGYFPAARVDVQSTNGRLISLEADLVDNANAKIQALLDAFNPNSARGNLLFNLSPLMNKRRRAAVKSTVTLIVTADANGATIPAGSIVSPEVGPERFITLDDVVIAPSSSGTVNTLNVGDVYSSIKKMIITNEGLSDSKINLQALDGWLIDTSDDDFSGVSLSETKSAGVSVGINNNRLASGLTVVPTGIFSPTVTGSRSQSGFAEIKSSLQKSGWVSNDLVPLFEINCIGLSTGVPGRGVAVNLSISLAVGGYLSPSSSMSLSSTFNVSLTATTRPSGVLAGFNVTPISRGFTISSSVILTNEIIEVTADTSVTGSAIFTVYGKASCAGDTAKNSMSASAIVTGGTVNGGSIPLITML